MTAPNYKNLPTDCPHWGAKRGYPCNLDAGESLNELKAYIRDMSNGDPCLRLQKRHDILTFMERATPAGEAACCDAQWQEVYKWWDKLAAEGENWQ